MLIGQAWQWAVSSKHPLLCAITWKKKEKRKKKAVGTRKVAAKVACPVRQEQRLGHMPDRRGYMPWAVGHALMSDAAILYVLALQT